MSLISQATPGRVRDVAQAARARRGRRQGYRFDADRVEAELIGAREHCADSIDPVLAWWSDR